MLICIIGPHWITIGRPLEAHWKHWLPAIISRVSFQCTLGSKCQAHWTVTELPQPQGKGTNLKTPISMGCLKILSLERHYKQNFIIHVIHQCCNKLFCSLSSLNEAGIRSCRVNAVASAPGKTRNAFHLGCPAQFWSPRACLQDWESCPFPGCQMDEGKQKSSQNCLLFIRWPVYHQIDDVTWYDPYDAIQVANQCNVFEPVLYF